MNLNFKKIILFLIGVFFAILIFYKMNIGVYQVTPLLLIISFILVMVIFMGVPIVVFSFFNYLSRKTMHFNKLNKIDFENDKPIYRDILANYSPVMLAYLDNMKFDYDISIVGGLLSLVNSKFIKIVDDKIEVIKFDFYNLDLPERYIVENIKDGKVMIKKNDSQFYKMIIEECKRKKIFKTNKNWLVIFGEKVIKLILIFVIWYVIYNWNPKLVNEELMEILFFFGWIYVVFYAITFDLNPYCRNKNGEELNQRLEGLKKYLKEYSSLKDRKSQDIVLWEDYLIYSVIFNQNKNIILEYEKYYKDN